MWSWGDNANGQMGNGTTGDPRRCQSDGQRFDGRSPVSRYISQSGRGSKPRTTAASYSYSTNEDTTLTVPAPGVLPNYSDPDGDTLTAVKVTDPSHGSLTLNADGSFTYTPNPDYHGSDSFTYKANDGSLTPMWPRCRSR